MTNKEVIRCLKYTLYMTEDCEFYEAIRMAIEALEQYQCCGNCTYHNDGDYWCCERNLATDDDMHCSDWSEEEC